MTCKLMFSHVTEAVHCTPFNAVIYNQDFQDLHKHVGG